MYNLVTRLAVGSRSKLNKIIAKHRIFFRIIFTFYVTRTKCYAILFSTLYTYVYKWAMYSSSLT